MPATRPIALLATALLSALALSVAPPASARPDRDAGPIPRPWLDAPVEPDGTRVVWQQGREVTAGFKFPGPDGPFPAPGDREVDVYLFGAVDPAAAKDPGGVRCPPPGLAAPCLYVPAHDDAFPASVRGYRTRALANGHWVVPSDDAPAGALVVRDVTAPDDLPTDVAQPFAHVTELVSAIRVGGRYQPLTSTHWVEYGVRRGWLELDDSVGFGGTAWVVDR